MPYKSADCGIYRHHPQRTSSGLRDYPRVHPLSAPSLWRSIRIDGLAELGPRRIDRNPAPLRETWRRDENRDAIRLGALTPRAQSM